MSSTPSVGIIMGSQSDWATLRHAAETLQALDVPHEVRIVSAHRTPDRLYQYAKGARVRRPMSPKARKMKTIPIGRRRGAELQ